MESRLSERANDVRRLARCYSGEAEVYKRLWAPVLYPFGLRLVRALPMGQARRVLEIGTGIGLLLPEIQKAAPASVVVGVDIAEGMLKLAPRSCLPAVMDASQLALQSDQFDAALLPFVLFHLPQPAEALRGVGRVLRRGGLVGTVTWGDRPEFPAQAVWSEELDRQGAPPVDPHRELVLHELMNTPQKVKQLLSDAGFRSVQTWMEDFECRAGLEEFIERRIQLSAERVRFEGLEQQARSRFMANVRERLGRLSPEGFVMRAEVVYATAAFEKTNHPPPPSFVGRGAN